MTSPLAVIPILFPAQLAFITSFAVLLDTLIVRSLLVQVLCHDIGPAIWCPSRLVHTGDGTGPSAVRKVALT